MSCHSQLILYTPCPLSLPLGDTERKKQLIKVVDLQLSDSKVSGLNLESIWLTSCLRWGLWIDCVDSPAQVQRLSWSQPLKTQSSCALRCIFQFMHSYYMERTLFICFGLKIHPLLCRCKCFLRFIGYRGNSEKIQFNYRKFRWGGKLSAESGAWPPFVITCLAVILM